MSKTLFYTDKRKNSTLWIEVYWLDEDENE